MLTKPFLCLRKKKLFNTAEDLLNIYKSIEPKGLHLIVLKEAREQLTESQTHIFNLSIASGKSRGP